MSEDSTQKKLKKNPGKEAFITKPLDDKQVFVFSGQLFYSCALVKDDLRLKIDDYQFFCDCVWDNKMRYFVNNLMLNLMSTAPIFISYFLLITMNHYPLT